jgi:serine/threonine kinase 16
MVELVCFNNRSLGCTLYAMAFKQSPFDGSMTAATSANIHFPAQDPYGKAFQSVIKAILQQNPANRPALTQIIAMLEKLCPESAYGKENV